jgi:hypothetical protein
MSNIYILHAAVGNFDDWNSVILGAYSTQQEAEASKQKISEAVKNYHQQLVTNNDIVKSRLAEWKGKMMSAKEVSMKEREISFTTKIFSGYCKLLDWVKGFKGSDYVNSEFTRKDFFKKADEMISKLPAWITVEPLPDFPPIITWNESHPIVWDYLMTITEVADPRGEGER